MLAKIDKIADIGRADLVVRSTSSALTKTDLGVIDMAVLTQARVREYFNYDPAIGLLIVKERSKDEFDPAAYARHLKRIGQQAGFIDPLGYRRVSVEGRNRLGHRVIWLLVYGEWVEYPDFEIDHINGDRSDNRIANLRKVTKTQNQRNAGQRVSNTSGVHGVNWKAGANRWVARIWNGPRHIYLGQFKSLHEAQIARKAAERVLGYTGTEREAGTYPKPASGASS